MRLGCNQSYICLCALLLAGLFPFTYPQNASAHPLAQGRIEVIVNRDHITLWARVSVEQVIVQQLLPTNADATVNTPSEVYRKHGDYLLEHLFVKADDALLKGKVLSVSEPDQKSIFPPDAGKEFVTYEINYPLTTLPALIELSQNVLNEVDFTPGNRWEATYVTGIRQEQKQGLDNLLLISTGSIPFSCDWSAPVEPPTATVIETKLGPPARLNEVVEAPSNKLQFALGLILGIAIICALLSALKRWKKPAR